MSEKSNKLYRRLWRSLERNGLEQYEYLTFFQKLKWRFNKKKYVEWYCENNNQNYYYFRARI